jgi:hypothetical protein
MRRNRSPEWQPGRDVIEIIRDIDARKSKAFLLQMHHPVTKQTLRSSVRRIDIIFPENGFRSLPRIGSSQTRSSFEERLVSARKNGGALAEKRLGKRKISP